MTVALTREDDVAFITLRRPERKNALDEPTAEALAACVAAVGADAAVRAVVLTGEGGAFSSGADVKAELGPAEGGASPFESRVRTFHAIVRGFAALPQPVVALVDGPAVGFGCSLALGADLVVATDRAYFQLAFVRLGLVSDGGATWLLPRRVGTARAMELLLLGERIDAERALAWGLVNRVVPVDRAADETRALAQRLARGPARAYARLRRLVQGGWERPFDAQLDAEAEAQLEALHGPELSEGVLAFLERRDPDFRKVPQ